MTPAEASIDGPRVARRTAVVITALFLSFAVYAGLFIYRTSFTVAGERYFSLFDDAMISMRYAKNLASGYGLTWNPGGARVEGYTNFLWTLYMSAIHLMPIPASKISVVVQITAAVLLLVNLFFVRRLAYLVSGGSDAVAAGAILLTGSYLPINNWSLQGMEVALLVPLTTVSLWLTLRSLDEDRVRVVPYVLLGLATLVRPDMAVTLAAVVVFRMVTDAPRWRRHLAWGVCALLVFGAAQTLFRLRYFGDVLPNTYYLKMTGYPIALRISRGAYVLALFIWKFNVLLFTLPFLLLFGEDLRVALLLWVLIVQMAYSVYTGGDAWEYWGGSNRFISIAMPGLFVSLSLVLFRVSGALLRTMRTASANASRFNALVFASLIALSVVCVNSIYGVEAWAEVLLIHTPLHTGNGDENNQEVEEAMWLRGVTTDDATLAVVRAGTIPYFADRPGIDLLGKTDRHVAHEISRVARGTGRFVEFRPGHTKFDYPYSIEQQRPDVVVQLWEHPEEIAPFLRRFYTPVRLHDKCIYLRTDSSRVLWDRVPPARCTGS